jgi:hypothetical protein
MTRRKRYTRNMGRARAERVPRRGRGTKYVRFAHADDDRAVCWFHASAREHIKRARRLSILVRRAGIPIVERWHDEIPGLICSEDATQLAVASFWN